MSDYIDRQAVKDWLLRWEGYIDKDTITRMQYRVIDIPSVEVEPVKHGRWIPCRERLPEGAKRTYWVCTDEGDQMECRWTNANLFFSNLTTDWHWNVFDIPQYQKVIAWMPLPDPYTEEGEPDVSVD